jgi:TRAP-type mannitol/chloroaromatic compound transport system permease large subunit
MRPQLLLLLALAFLLAPSCAQHQVTKPSGEELTSTTVLAKGGMTVAPDGTVVMFTDADAATKAITDFARAAIFAGLMKTGINAASDLGQTITQEVTKP